MPGTPNDVIVLSNGVNVTIHTMPSSGNAGTSDTVALPVQGVNNGIPQAHGNIVANPTSTLIRPANTTAYAANQLIASSTTAGSVIVPSIIVARLAAGSFSIRRLRLLTNGTTGWNQTFTIRLWSAAPTYANGDGGAYSVATGAAAYLGAFSVLLIIVGDGSVGYGVPTIGSDANIALASGQIIYWDLQITTGTPTPLSGQTFTLTAEVTQN